MFHPTLLRNPIVRKLLMAFSGLLLAGFIVAHLLGNLTVFLGPDGINAYAHHLQQLGPLLWVFRGGLLAAAGMHVGFGILLTLENRRARPKAYYRSKPQRSTLAGRTMIYSGLGLATFAGFHLLHFTLRLLGPAITPWLDALQRPDVFRMLVIHFRLAGFVLVYILGMGALFLHLSHGLGSLLQTFGLSNDRTLPWFGLLSSLIAALLAVGFAAIPALIFFGFITLQGGAA
jgi:succinate dehydrogenase / fumarate reductase, cytochrome b subunit